MESSSRYELLVKIATGGMATVYVGQRVRSHGFARFVAIKRAHPHLLEDPAMRRRMVEEATLASRIHHPNVVAIHDIEHSDDELLLVMDYVEGGSLSELIITADRAKRSIPLRIGIRVALDACAGLSAVHDLTGADGRPSGLVHRDVSPQNILVGVNGIARIADFGVARLAEGQTATNSGVLWGKASYLPPEYIQGERYTERSDQFALAVVVWELLTNRPLFRGENEADTLMRVVGQGVRPPSSIVATLGPQIDAILLRALEKNPDQRHPSVSAFAEALESAARRRDLLATHAEVGALVRDLCGAAIDRRREQLREWSAEASDAPEDGLSLAPESSTQDPSAEAAPESASPSSLSSAPAAEGTDDGERAAGGGTRARRGARWREARGAMLGVVIVAPLVVGAIAWAVLARGGASSPTPFKPGAPASSGEHSMPAAMASAQPAPEDMVSPGAALNAADSEAPAARATSAEQASARPSEPARAATATASPATTSRAALRPAPRGKLPTNPYKARLNGPR